MRTHTRGHRVVVRAACLLFTSLMIFCLALPVRPVPAQTTPNITEGLLDSYEQLRRATAALMEAAVVFIYAESDSEAGSGSGFVIGPGLIMTNGHVVDMGQNTEVWVMNQLLPMTKVQVVGFVNEPDHFGADFALLRFTPPSGVNLPALAFNSSVSRMDHVAAWGYPAMITQYDDSVRGLYAAQGDGQIRGVPPVVYTEGTVSTLVHSRRDCIIHTAPIASGNSGGPLVNRYAEVVGINTWGATEEDEGAFVNAALLADDIIAFLARFDVRPIMASSQTRAQTYAADPAAYGQAQGGGQPPAGVSQPQDSGLASSGYEGSPAPIGVGPGPLPIGGGQVQSDGLHVYPSASSTPYTDNDGASDSPAISGILGAGDTNLPGADRLVTDEEARSLLLRAQAGDPDAMAAVGWNYFQGIDGFPLDHSKGLMWLNQAAEAGNHLAQGLMGMLYLIDDDIRDPARGLAYLKQSAAAPEADPDIQGYLALILYEGRALGVPANLRESLHWAQQAANNGSATGKAVLGFHYYDGAVIQEDLVMARALAEQAAQSGGTTGKALLATVLYADGSFERSPDKVLSLAEEAANAGDGCAQGLLGLIYAFDSSRLDYVQAEKWARLAAGQANYRGQYVLGYLYLSGLVVERNLPLAWAYLSMADEEMDDPEFVSGGPLLRQVEQFISPRELEQGRQILKNWRIDWGLDTN